MRKMILSMAGGLAGGSGLQLELIGRDRTRSELGENAGGGLEMRNPNEGQ